MTPSLTKSFLFLQFYTLVPICLPPYLYSLKLRSKAKTNHVWTFSFSTSFWHIFATNFVVLEFSIIFTVGQLLSCTGWSTSVLHYTEAFIKVFLLSVVLWFNENQDGYMLQLLFEYWLICSIAPIWSWSDFLKTSRALKGPFAWKRLPRPAFK